MAYSFNYNKKAAEMAYILYMIIGSYFHKCICRTDRVENSVLRCYSKMPADKQMEKEQQVIRRFENMMEYNLSQIENMNCEAFINRHRNGEFSLKFRTSFEQLEVFVDQEGNYQMVFYEKAIPGSEAAQAA